MLAHFNYIHSLHAFFKNRTSLPKKIINAFLLYDLPVYGHALAQEPVPQGL